jgi:FAD synthase
MKFHKKINDNIIAIAGTWDPFLPRHKALFTELLRHSKKKGLNPYVFVFYPNPANYLHENQYKDYFDLDVRIELFKHLGINNVIVLDFDREDLKLTAADLFNELLKSTGIVLNELWIGENQSFGTGPEGIFTIRTECDARNIKLRILKNSFLVNLDKDDINRNFRQGRFDLTSAIVGYFPTYKLREGLEINMYDGIYNAKLGVKPFDKTDEMAVKVKIINKKLEEIKRADDYNWLILLEKIPAETL